MVFDDLRSFLDECEKCGDLEKVEGADWNLEIGTISEMAAEKFGPALLFDKIKGYPPGF
jgi:UbiD family decarboxylase